MAGTLIVSNLKTDTDNSFIVRSNTGTTLFVANTTGIDVANSFASSSITSDKILTVANTKISGNIISSQITSVANTQITGNIASPQITSNPTLYGNVSVTGVIAVGGATPTTNGSGITFPATQSASSDVNTLDDYEEGDFTPSITQGVTTVINREHHSFLDSCKLLKEKSSIYINEIFSKVESLRKRKKFNINNINNFSFLKSFFILLNITINSYILLSCKELVLI
jgi:hypothetical protein